MILLISTNRSYIKYSNQVPYVVKNSPNQFYGKIDQVEIALFSHIVLSRKNQEEIFASLSKNDFKKIISNLED